MSAFRVILFPFLASFAFGQASPPRLEFEVASIRPAAPLLERASFGLHVDGAQVNCNGFSLKDYVMMAYKLKPYQVEGPEWLASQRFDVSAKLPDGATREDVPQMLIALLEDRFHLKVHRDTKDFPVYGLLKGKGDFKGKESEPDSTGGNVNVAVEGGRGGVSINMGHGSSFTFADNRMVATKLTMTAVADSLGRFCDKPVVDMTGLKGAYDFTLEFTPEDYQAMLIRSAVNAGVSLPPQAMRLMENASGDSLFTAVERVGLKLESRKAPLEELVIDHIEKMPTEN